MPADPEDEGKRPSTLDPEHLQNATNLWKQIKFKGIVHPEILTLISLQTRMSFCHPLRTKIFWRTWTTKQLTSTVIKKNTIKVNGYRQVFVTNILQKKSYFVFKKELRGLEQIKSNFHFWVNCPFKISLDESLVLQKSPLKTFLRCQMTPNN